METRIASLGTLALDEATFATGFEISAGPTGNAEPRYRIIAIARNAEDFGKLAGMIREECEGLGLLITEPHDDWADHWLEVARGATSRIVYEPELSEEQRAYLAQFGVATFAELDELIPEDVDDPQCAVCGTYKSEHALCGCGHFMSAEALAAERKAIEDASYAEMYGDDFDPARDRADAAHEEAIERAEEAGIPIGRCLNCWHDFAAGPCGGCGAYETVESYAAAHGAIEPARVAMPCNCELGSCQAEHAGEIRCTGADTPAAPDYTEALWADHIANY